MAGVLLESLSNRNLIVLFSVLLTVQIIFFVIGGLVCKFRLKSLFKCEPNRRIKVAPLHDLCLIPNLRC